jgi:hypothetical protein
MNRFVADWRKIVSVAKTEPDRPVRIHPPNEWPLRMTAAQGRQYMLRCLHYSITSAMPAPGKKFFEPYQTDIMRDRQALRLKREQRVPIYGFNTATCRKRLAHLVEEREG